MNLKINDDGQMMTQDVGLNYEDNFCKILKPALDNIPQATIIHYPEEVKFNIQHIFLTIK